MNGNVARLRVFCNRRWLPVPSPSFCKNSRRLIKSEAVSRFDSIVYPAPRLYSFSYLRSQRRFQSSNSVGISQSQTESVNNASESLRKTVGSGITPDDSRFEIDIDQLLDAMPPSPDHAKARLLLDLYVATLNEIQKTLDPELSAKALINANLKWEELNSRCVKMDKLITKSNFGGVLLNFCLKHRNYPVAENYLKWEKNPTLTALTLFFRLCSESPTNVGQCGGEERLVKLYETVKAKNKNVWDMDSGERIVVGLCKTRLWKDSLEIMKSMEMGGKLPGSCYAAVASAAFRNGEPDLAWEILVQQAAANKSVPDEPLVAWLETCEPNEANMKKLLEYMDIYEQYGFEDLVTAIRTYFEDKLGYQSKNTDLTYDKGTRKLVCASCRVPIKSSNLSHEEFHTLQEHFLTRVLESDDLFYNTTPEELSKYKEFIEQTAPFDYVLDGLNVAFCRGPQGNPAQALKEVVLHLNRQQKKILVIGRKHMNTWPVRHINHVRRMSKFYLINDNSEDDPFMIWATLKSGPGAKFISKDLLRNHSFRLKDPELARLFKRWRLSSQLGVSIDCRGAVTLDPFTDVFPVPQKDGQSGYWHVPYQLDSKSPYDVPKKWICLRSKDK